MYYLFNTVHINIYYPLINDKMKQKIWNLKTEKDIYLI